MNAKLLHSLKNSLILFIRMIFIMLITLYSSRLLLDILNLENFGIYDIVAGVVVLFVVFNSALTSTVQRFLNISIEERDKEKFDKYFNISLFIFIMLGSFLFILGFSLKSYIIGDLLNIPADKEGVAETLFSFSLLNIVLQMLRVPFTAILFANEKLGFHSFISILEAVGKLWVVVLIPFLNFNYLINYAILLLLLTAFIGLVYAFYLKRMGMLPTIYLVRSSAEYKNILNFSKYSVLGGGVSMLNQQSTALLLNKFFGVLLNASNGVVNQVNAALFQILSSIQNAFSPLLMKAFVSGEEHEIKNIMFVFTRLCMVTYLIIAVPLVVLMPEVLGFWLKEVPLFTTEFTRLMIISLFFDVLSTPLWTLVHAEGNLKRYQLILSVIIIMNILLAWLLMVLLNNPIIIWYVKLFGSFCIFLYRYFYVKSILSINFFDYFNHALKSGLIFGLALSVSSLLYIYNNNLFIYLFIYSVWVMVSIYFLALNRSERELLENKFLKKGKSL